MSSSNIEKVFIELIRKNEHLIYKVTYWMYKRIYDANIMVIKKSLDELDELK